MFTPDQERAATQMIRVCKRGGKIGLASWTPESFIGQLFKTIGNHLPPPPAAKSPARWGTRAGILELFGYYAETVETAHRHFVFRYRSPEHFLDVFKTYYGPVLKAFAALRPDVQAALEENILALISKFNSSGNGSAVIPSEYLEAVITRS
jgi:hypothetical protein